MCINIGVTRMTLRGGYIWLQGRDRSRVSVSRGGGNARGCGYPREKAGPRKFLNSNGDK
jgi:hypothetical protein